jgi:hypothetical protein
VVWAVVFLQPVAEEVEPRLVLVAQRFEILGGQRIVLAELVEVLERGVGEAHGRLHVLAPALLALAQTQPPDQGRECEPGHHERDHDRAVGEQDHQHQVRELEPASRNRSELSKELRRLPEPERAQPRARLRQLERARPDVDAAVTTARTPETWSFSAGT